jgi:hypothetical protein
LPFLGAPFALKHPLTPVATSPRSMQRRAIGPLFNGDLTGTLMEYLWPSEAGRRWVSTRTAQAVTWADFSIPIMQSSTPSALQPSFSPELCELPDKHATREIISAFFRSRFTLRFPVLDEILFETTIETAYGPADGPLSSPRQVSARACVLSALSIASRVNSSRQISRSMDMDLCAAKAHYLLLHIAKDISLSTLQTALVLVSPGSIVACS